MGERFRKTPSTKGSPLRVTRVRVAGLFGLYDHDIPLNLDDRVTILHGPNGVGKTVLLKLIAAVFNGQFEELPKVPFKKLEIDFSGERKLAIECERMPPNALIGEDEEHTLYNVSVREHDWENRVVLRESTRWGISDDGVMVPAGKAIAWTRTHEKRPATVMVAADTATPLSPMDLRGAEWPEPTWLSAFCKYLDVHFIETQRLLRAGAPEDGGGLIPTVREYARDLHLRINEALAAYATVSQSLDQSFPQRLLKKSGKRNGLSVSELKTRMIALNERRAHLHKIGLLEPASDGEFDMESLDSLDHAQSSVMTLYVEDTEQKLGVLDDLSRRITLLLNNVNGKFRNKSIEINRSIGFVVLGHDGHDIEPVSLSSGEQHELVQLYDLLFRVKPGTLVFIDEPELSLHVLWQKRYLPELLEIAKTAEFDAIIATHSPFIVGDRSDLMVPLLADIDS